MQLALDFDPVLARIIAQVESSQFPFAIRYEPGIKSFQPELLRLIYKGNRLADADKFGYSATARVIYATSYGKFQVMGYELYQLGFTGAVGEYLGNEEEQERMFSMFLNAKRINSAWESLKANQPALTQFALKYNGSDQYANRMLGAAKALGL